jgi:hypothetical protein
VVYQSKSFHKRQPTNGTELRKMPRLKILGKPSVFAGDDIRIPMIIGMMFRILQMGMAFPLMGRVLMSERLKADSEVIPHCIENSDEDFKTWPVTHAVELLIGYTASSGVVATMGFVEYATMFYLSQKGTPSIPGPRKHLDMLATINFSITYYVRIGTLLFGMVIIAVAIIFCGCVYEYELAEDDMDDNIYESAPALRGIDAARAQCKMFRSGWTVCLSILFFSQFTDVIFGGFYYLSRIIGFIPEGAVLRAEAKWELCCRCCFGCLSCLTCFRMGGMETVGSGELQHFASIIAEYFESGGILDIAPTDILVGLHITKLIHFEEEYTARHKLSDKSAIAIEGETKQSTLPTVEEEENEITLNSITENLVNQAEVGDESESSSPIQDLDVTIDGNKSIAVEQDSLFQQAEVGLENEPDVPHEDQESNKDGTIIVKQLSLVDPTEVGEESESKVPGVNQECRKDDDIYFSELEMMIKQTEQQFEKAGIQMTEPESNELSAHLSTYSGQSEHPRNTSRASHIMFKRFKNTDDEKPSDSNYKTVNYVLPVEHTAFSPEKKEEKYLIAEGARYIDFATSIYTWSVQHSDSVCDWTSCTKEQLIRKFEQTRRAFLSAPIGHVNDEDIQYSNFTAGIAATPYAVVMDHPWKSVVVTIRGSQSIDDMMSDLTLNQTELNVLGERYRFDGAGRYCHKGILDCAEWVTEDLLKSGALDRLLLNDDATHKDYQLRIVGHSLGAAAASIVALFLRSKFPAVRAVIYESPGCTVSRNLAEESCAWCVSFVTGMDVIPRFTVESIADLRDEMLVNIARIKIPKYLINRNRRIHENGIDAVREFLAEALYPVDDIPETIFLDTVRRFRLYYKSKVAKRVADGDAGLFLPGRVIHLVGGADSVYKERRRTGSIPFMEEECMSCWAGRDDFRAVVLSPSFLTDHETDVVKLRFDSLTKGFGLKEPYTEVLLEECD